MPQEVNSHYRQEMAHPRICQRPDAHEKPTEKSLHQIKAKYQV
jgi:hypothetical protein